MSVIDRSDAVLFTMLGEALSTPSIHATIGFDEPRARATDPETSHKAADSISVEAREASERYVLEVLASCGPLTDEEILATLYETGDGLAFSWSPSRLRTARKQLSDDGLVVPAGAGRTRSGRQAQKWAVT